MSEETPGQEPTLYGGDQQAQEATPAERVERPDRERVGRALYEAGAARKMNVGPPWEQLEQEVREAWHEYADAALAAARLPERPDERRAAIQRVKEATGGALTEDECEFYADAALGPARLPERPDEGRVGRAVYEAGVALYADAVFAAEDEWLRGRLRAELLARFDPKTHPALTAQIEGKIDAAWSSARG